MLDKQQTCTQHARVSKQDLEKIKRRFEDFLGGDTKIS